MIFLIIFSYFITSALLSSDLLLSCLFPEDDGNRAPNPSSLYQLAKVG